MLRAAEMWMSEGGLDISEKGLFFEDVVNTRLQRWCDVSRVKAFRHLRASGDISFGDKKEQIDVLALVGKRTVLVGECKCTKYPVDARTRREHFDYLEQKAVRQLTRKLSFLNNNKAAFCKMFGIEVDPSELRFLPVIIINHSAGAGFTVGGYPVVDPPILRRYIEMGYVDFHIRNIGRGNFQGDYGFKLYEDAGDAERNLEYYLANAPQVRLHMRSIQDRQITYFDEQGYGEPVVIHATEVIGNHTQESLRRLVEDLQCDYVAKR